MAHRPPNLARTEWVIALLNLHSSDRVVEIGFFNSTAKHLAISRNIFLRI